LPWQHWEENRVSLAASPRHVIVNPILTLYIDSKAAESLNRVHKWTEDARKYCH